jgi:hypothetical protein
MMTRPTDIAVRPDATRVAIYTCIPTDLDVGPILPLMGAQRARCEQGVREHAHLGHYLTGATYDDAVPLSALREPGGLPAFERLLGHVEAGRVHVVFVFSVRRAIDPVDDLLERLDRLAEAGAKVVNFTFFDGPRCEPAAAPGVPS